MRKVVSMLLIALMCCGLLTGCAKPKVQKLGLTDNSEEVVEDVQEDNDADEENEMSPEEEAELLKEQEESLTIYADMISEIEQELPELDIQYIVDSDDGGRNMSIHMELQQNKDATYNIISQFLVTKETLLNNNEINEITVFVYNNGENDGILMFQNEAGRYEPTVNTL